MKRIALLILIIAGFSTAKAQQLIPTKPEIKLTDSLNFFKPNTYQSPKSFLLQPLQINNLAIPTDKNARMVYSRMPVLSVASNDRMPVAGMGLSANRDNMPVLKIITVDPLATDKQQTP